MKKVLEMLNPAYHSRRTTGLMLGSAAITGPLTAASFLGPQEPGISWVGWGLLVGLAVAVCAFVSAYRDVRSAP